MADTTFSVEVTAAFATGLQRIEEFLADADADFAFDALIDALRRSITPNLARFPRLGRRYLDTPPQSAEALAKLAEMPAGGVDTLREYIHGDYLILYSVSDARRTVYLLSIRHHRELSFDLARVWPGAPF